LAAKVKQYLLQQHHYPPHTFTVTEYFGSLIDGARQVKKTKKNKKNEILIIDDFLL
jgi:hypothetical protein